MSRGTSKGGLREKLRAERREFYLPYFQCGFGATAKRKKSEKNAAR
jgi:hypothetical protein